MLNAATLVAGLAVLAIVMISAYFTYGSLKRSGCAGCGRCSNDCGPSCGQCPKNR